MKLIVSFVLLAICFFVAAVVLIAIREIIVAVFKSVAVIALFLLILLVYIFYNHSDLVFGLLKFLAVVF